MPRIPDDFDEDFTPDIDDDQEDEFPETDDYLDEDISDDEASDISHHTMAHTTSRTHGFRQSGEDDQYDTELLNYKKSFSNTEFLAYVLQRIDISDLSPECKRQLEDIAHNYFSEAAQLGNFEDTSDIYLRIKQAILLVSTITTPADRASKAYLEICSHLQSHSFFITTRAIGPERERIMQLVTDRSETITRTSSDQATQPAAIHQKKGFLGKIFG